MSDSEIRALLTIALMAALADGGNDDRERAALKSLATRIGEDRIDLTDVYDDVLVRKVSRLQRRNRGARPDDRCAKPPSVDSGELGERCLGVRRATDASLPIRPN